MRKKKFPLGFFPTPVHRLDRLSELWGYDLYIKRDDQTGLVTGGNKTRKLEFLIQEALDNGFDTVITAGAQQSNHCRQTAAAAVVADLECHLMLNGNEPEIYQGNLLLDKILGANLHFSGESVKSREEDLIDLKNALERNGKKVYLIPVGGSNFTGAMGYVEAVQELKEQMQQMQVEFDYIFFATSSGGTQAGMMLGKDLYGIKAELMPIKIDKDDDFKISLKAEILEILRKGEKEFGITKSYSIDEIPMIKEYNKEEYGKLTQNEQYAIDLLAKTEGILLDPVYTGRAFYGMSDMLSKKKIPKYSKILFWHTGGIPALFAYANQLTK